MRWSSRVSASVEVSVCKCPAVLSVQLIGETSACFFECERTRAPPSLAAKSTGRARMSVSALSECCQIRSSQYSNCFIHVSEPVPLPLVVSRWRTRNL